jgi:hypothetical protein
VIDYSDPRKLGDYLAKRIAAFDEAEDSSRTVREKAERDIDYYDGKQLTDEEVKELKRRGQPPQVQNVIRDKLDYWFGLEKDQRTDPRALPRTPQHEQDAEAATDSLRFVADDNDWPSVRSMVWQDFLKAGWGGVEVVAEPKAPSRSSLMNTTAMTPPQQEWRVIVRRTPWDRMFWDPYSAMDDFSDARYLGEVRWMDREQAAFEYGDTAGKVFDETVSMGVAGETYDDKPKNWRWVSRDRKRVRVIKMYHVEGDGQWYFCEFTKGGILKGGVSPWLNERGEPECAYVWRSAYMDRDNNRYGVIRDMIDVQDAINKRLSKFLHLVNSRQTFGSASITKDARTIREQLARPDGHIPIPDGMEFGKHFGVIPTGDMADGQFTLLQQAMTRFDTLGPNADMMGDGGKSKSGRAILANQQGGMIQLGTLFDSLRSMDKEVFTKCWSRIRQFWTGEVWVRVTDNEQNLKWVGINTPVIDEMTGQPVIDPMTGQPQLQNQVSQLEVDIIIDEAPDSANIQAEQFGQLTDLANAGVIFPPKVYIAASSLRNKGELIRIMEEATQGPAPDPAAQQAMMADAQSKIEKTQSETAKNIATARKTEVETARLMHEPIVQPMQPGMPQETPVALG